MDDTKLFKAMQTQNLNCLAMFYRHVSIAIKDVAKEIDDWEAAPTYPYSDNWIRICLDRSFFL